MHEAGFRHIKISPPFTLEEVEAAVDEARIQNMRITSHGGGVSDTVPPSMTRVAIEGGVQGIEHPPKMSEGTLELMAQKGVYWVPTIGVYLRQIQEPDAGTRLLTVPPTTAKRADLVGTSPIK